MTRRVASTSRTRVTASPPPTPAAMAAEEEEEEEEESGGVSEVGRGVVVAMDAEVGRIWEERKETKR